MSEEIDKIQDEATETCLKQVEKVEELGLGKLKEGKTNIKDDSISIKISSMKTEIKPSVYGRIASYFATSFRKDNNPKTYSPTVFQKYIIFFFILVISFSVRIFNLSDNPAGFFCDEAVNGYNAYTILTTGKDQYGTSFPIFFRAFDDYRCPISIYSMVPFVGIFGLNEFSVRFTNVIYGILTVIMLFLFVKECFNINISILSSLLLAISPWHIHFSRTGFEFISYVFWIILSLFLLEKSLKKFSPWYPLAAFSLVVSLFTYHPAKICVPLTCIIYFLLNYKQSFTFFKKKSFWIINIIAVIIVVILIYPSIKDGTFNSRWNIITGHPLNIKGIFQAYLNHFSISFLFSKGDIDFPGQFITRHSVRGMGELYWFQLPFLIFGLISVFFIKEYRHKILFVILFLFLVYPIGSIFTTINPFANRSIIGVIPFQILTAIGIYACFRVFKSDKIRISMLITFILIVTASFAHYIILFNNYPSYSVDFYGWQYGPKEIINYFKSVEKKYDECYLTRDFNAPAIFPQFYDPMTKKNKIYIGDNNYINLSKNQCFAMRTDEIKPYLVSDIKFYIITGNTIEKLKGFITEDKINALKGLTNQSFSDKKLPEILNNAGIHEYWEIKLVKYYTNIIRVNFKTTLIIPYPNGNDAFHIGEYKRIEPLMDAREFIRDIIYGFPGKKIPFADLKFLEKERFSLNSINKIETYKNKLIVYTGNEDPFMFDFLDFEYLPPLEGGKKWLIVIKYKCSVQGSFQIFYSFKTDFDNENSYITYVHDTDDIKEVIIPLPVDDSKRRLYNIRFDPPDNAIFEIDGVEIMYEN